MEAKIITRETPAQESYTVMYGTDCVAVPLKKEHAVLIAAAPDLLAALNDALDLIRSLYSDARRARDIDIYAERARVQAIRAAIAKAQGA